MVTIISSKVSMETISNDPTQTVISFRVQPECDAQEWSEISAILVGKILKERSITVVSKQDSLMDLLSDAVLQPQQDYIRENTIKVESFVPEPESKIEHHATIVNRIPEEVVQDIATGSEFSFGNLWFLVPVGNNDKDDQTSSSDLLNDVLQLTPSNFSQLPHLSHEVVASPAMYDGCQILWFNPNKEILNTVVRPMFEN